MFTSLSCTVLSERAEELESAIGELEASMGEQEADADAVIEQWENRCTEHEEQIEDLIRRLQVDLADRAPQLTIKECLNK